MPTAVINGKKRHILSAKRQQSRKTCCDRCGTTGRMYAPAVCVDCAQPTTKVFA